MIEPKLIDLKGMKFQLIPFKATEALRLDKIILELIVPVLGCIQEFSLDAKINMETLVRGVSEALSNFDDSKTIKLILDMLKNVTYIETGKAPQELNKEAIDIVFQGKHTLIFELIFEIMRFNKFSPFVLVEGGGNLTGIISSLSNQKKEEKKNGNKSEMLGNLLET